MKKFRILNPAQMQSIKGGEYTCHKSGDTIIKLPLCIGSVTVIKLCETHEATCSGAFSSRCGSNGVTINCSTFSVNN